MVLETLMLCVKLAYCLSSQNVRKFRLMGFIMKTIMAKLFFHDHQTSFIPDESKLIGYEGYLKVVYKTNKIPNLA